MLAKTYSAALVGVDAYSVEVEVNASGMGEQTFTQIVGLPDAAVRESRERVKSALTSCGFLHPFGATTVNLAPADLKKSGAAFDLPIAMGMIAAIDQLDRDMLTDVMIIGELALDGGVRPCSGALPVAQHAKNVGMRMLIVPAANAAEAGIIQGLTVIGVNSLLEAVQCLREELDIMPTRTDVQALFSHAQHDAADLDFADVKGQELAKRAAEVSAAGGHNLILIGPPGTGKSMIASRMPSILPLMTLDEALETTKVHSIAGELESGCPLVTRRPFRSPHHTISDAGLLGGQSNPRPGEVSLAHNGVLFLDEFTEFKRSTLEVMRQPLELRRTTITRAAGSVTFPSSFQLVAAMNPCPCGYYGSQSRQCRCTQGQIQKYRARISGPLLDRIDLHVEVNTLSDQEMLDRPRGEASAVIRERVVLARDRQNARYVGTDTTCNAAMTPKQLHAHCELDKACRNLMEMAINELQLSNRAFDRILRVSRTLADLEGHDAIAPHHISEAIQFRSLDRRMW